MIVLVAGAAVVLYVLFFRATSESDPNQGAIRGYYESRLGGSVPSDVADRLHVDLCGYRPLEETGGIAILRCDVTVGTRAYSPCFGFTIDSVVSGPYQIHRSDCDRLVYDAARRDFVLANP
jgi:hypothetical protein